jgi:hypothetical protein
MTSLNNLIESVIVHAKHRDIITISKVFRVNLTKNKILIEIKDFEITISN